MTKTPPELIEVAFIRAAHGLKGQVVVHAYSRDETSLVGYGPLQNKDGTRHFDIKVINDKGSDFLCRIDGVTDRNAAEALRGTKLYTPADRLPEPEEDEYYIRDLVGLVAVTPEGVIVGKVIDVMNLAAHDALEITFTHDGTNPLPSPQTELLLMTDENVPDIDLDAGQVTVVLPHGLLETPD